MAKIVIKENKVFMRHWFIWYHVRGKHAHRMIFHKELKD